MEIIRLILALLRKGRGLVWWRKHGANVIEAVKDAGEIAEELQDEGVVPKPDGATPKRSPDKKETEDDHQRFPTTDPHGP